MTPYAITRSLYSRSVTLSSPPGLSFKGSVDSTRRESSEIMRMARAHELAVCLQSTGISLNSVLYPFWILRCTSYTGASRFILQSGLIEEKEKRRTALRHCEQKGGNEISLPDVIKMGGYTKHGSLRVCVLSAASLVTDPHQAFCARVRHPQKAHQQSQFPPAAVSCQSSKTTSCTLQLSYPIPPVDVLSMSGCSSFPVRSGNTPGAPSTSLRIVTCRA